MAIRKIQLEGLKTTRKKVIMRELGSDVFGYFSQRRVDKSLSNLRRLSYIKDVKEAELLSDQNPEDGILKITLAERRNSSFSGILGYLPSSGGKGSLFGSMALVFDNMFGTGRRMEWNWSKKDPYSSRFSFLYRENWIFALPPTLELKLDQADYDSTYLQLSFEATLLFNSTHWLSWGLKGGWERVISGSAARGYLPDSKKYKTGLIVTVDAVDQAENPRRGVLYRSEIGYVQKRNYPTTLLIPGKQRTFQTILALDLNHFVPVFKNQTFFLGLHLKDLETDEKMIPVSDQFKLGGINTIRGYREEEFFGTRVAWTNIEYRFLLDEYSRFFLFTDYGYFQRKTVSPRDGVLEKTSEGRLGYGFGFRIDSKAGLLGIDYALGENDRLSQGKIHFGVMNRF
ncbi:MAG: BamA/TamA family outer membrane protein [Candidatus Zixiibacteriota bacterium]